MPNLCKNAAPDDMPRNAPAGQQDAKKNALKAGGATWAFASAMHL